MLEVRGIGLGLLLTLMVLMVLIVLCGVLLIPHAAARAAARLLRGRRAQVLPRRQRNSGISVPQAS